MNVSEHENVDPRPGDFDDELAALSPADVEEVPASSHSALAIEVVVRGDEATSLARLAELRGQEPSEVVAELIRSARGASPG